MPGIKTTKIGHLGGKEIVEVEYDPSQINLQEMAAALDRESSFDSMIVNDPLMSEKAQSFLKESFIEINGATPHFIEPKHTLRTRHPELYQLDLTEQQKIVLNSWSYFGGEMPDVLTDQQKEILKTKMGDAFEKYQVSDAYEETLGETLLGWFHKITK